MTLRNWLEQNFLVEHESSREEISDLLELVARDLEDAAVEQEKVDTLDAVRRMRHKSDYLRAGTASSREVEDVYRFATDLQERVLAWMRGEHPDLLDQ